MITMSEHLSVITKVKSGKNETNIQYNVDKYRLTINNSISQFTIITQAAHFNSLMTYLLEVDA